MSNNYAPSQDGRFSRDRSPPRNVFPGMHPSRSAAIAPANGSPSASQFAGDTAQAPTAPADSHRGRPFVDSAPQRGRTYSPRGDSRTGFRGRDPARTPRDPSPSGKRPWDESNQGKDTRSPSLIQQDYQDGREAGSREFDAARGRRGHREGPAPSRFPNSRQPPHVQGREGFARGRGRFDGPPVGRGRGSFPDDRGGPSRGRSRSPRSYRWERAAPREASRELFREPSRLPPREAVQDLTREPEPTTDRKPSTDARYSDRYEGVHPSRRFSNSDWADRDREQRSRDAESYRRDQLNSPSLYRNVSNSSQPATPRSYGAPSPALPTKDDSKQQAEERSDAKDGRPSDSAAVYSGLIKEESSSRRPPSRADSHVKEAAAPPSSPPCAPEVPAYGSLPTASNVWKAQPPIGPKAQTQTEDSDARAVSSKPPTSGSAINIENVAPRAPKAQRLEQSSQAPAARIPSGPMMRNPQHAPRALAGKSQAVVAPTPVASMTRPNAPRMPQPKTSVQVESPTSHQIPSAPSGPKAMIKSENSTPWSPGMPTGPSGRPGPNAPSVLPIAAPSGPRASGGSINAPSANKGVPLGPKAERLNQTQQAFRPPPGPTLGMHRQMQRQDLNKLPFRKPGIIPAKREAGGAIISETSQSPKTEPSEDSKIVVQSREASNHLPEQGDSKRHKAGSADNVNGNTIKSQDEVSAARKSSRRELDFSDDEEDMNLALDPAEIARHEEQFERDKARLEAQKTDLSSRRFRGCTPIEQLSLLNRLSLQDLNELTFSTPLRLPQSKKSQAPDIIEAPPNVDNLYDQAHNLIPLPVERAPPPLSPSPIGTPELKSLPFLVQAPMTPISDMDIFQENLKRQELAEGSLNIQLRLQSNLVSSEEESLRAQYATLYRQWRHQVQKLEHQRKQAEAASSESHEAVMEGLPDKSPLTNPTPEIRRRGGTEYDLQKAMEESLKLAQEQAQEEANRNSLPTRPDYDREALIPELDVDVELMRPIFKDTTCLREPRDAVTFFELIPPPDEFTKQEHEAVLQIYREYPKKFGKIAQGLPGRTYKECINHYYSTKWNGQYKTPRDKRKVKAAKGGKSRATTGNQVRPRADALMSNLDDAKPDLYDGDEAAAPIVAVTESGRPKRAAAPNFKEKEPVEVIPLATPAKRTGKPDGTIEGSGEKSTRKAKGPPKERKSKARNVASARPPTLSPAPPPVERQTVERMEIDPRDAEGASGLAQLSAGSIHVPLPRSNEQNPDFVDPHRHVMAAIPSEEASTTQAGRGAAPTITSSYWSVNEVNQFPQLLQHFGTDWQSISSQMGTKSQVMVKNYYSRMKGGPARAQWEAMANEADARRNNGEVPGPPPSAPAPLGPIRRRNDRLQVPGPRALAPNGEVIDLEGDGPPENTADPPHVPQMLVTYQSPMGKPVHRHGRPSSSDKALPQPAHATSSSNAHHSQTIRMPAEVQDVFARDTGPTESHLLRPHERLAPAMQSEDPRQMRYQDPQPMESSGPGIRHWKRHPQEEESQSYFQQPPSATALANRSPDRPTRYTDGPLFGVTQARPQYIERSASDNLNRPADRSLSTQSQATSKPLLDHVGSSRPASTSYFDPTRHTTSASKEPSRLPTSIAAFARDSKEQLAPEPSRSAPPSKSEPRKTSNLADILNKEPDETKPSKAFATPTAPVRTQTPPQFGPVQRHPYEPGVAPPQRPLSQPNRPEANPESQGVQPLSYQAPAFMQPPSSSRHLSDAKPREAPLHSSAFRIDWPPQRTYSTQPPDRANEAASPFGHRTSLKSGEEPRYGPPSSSAVVREPPLDSSSTFRPYAPFQPQQNIRVDPSPPPGRPYSYGPPAHAHSRETSSSRIPVSQAPAPQPHQQPLHQAQPLQRHRQDNHSGSGSYADAHRHSQQEQSQQPLPPTILPPHSLYATPQPQPSGPGNPFASSRPALQSNTQAIANNAASPHAIRERHEPRQTTDWTQGIHFRDSVERARQMHPPDREREHDLNRPFADKWEHDSRARERRLSGEQERMTERSRPLAHLQEMDENDRAHKERIMMDQRRGDEQRRQEDEQMHQQRYGPIGYAPANSPR